MTDFETKSFICGYELPVTTDVFAKYQAEADQAINDYIKNRSDNQISNRKFVVNVETKVIARDNDLHVLKVVTSYFED